MGQATIIGASMIEARMSRVCLPKDQDRGEGKGLSPRFRHPGLSGRRSRAAG